MVALLAAKGSARGRKSGPKRAHLLHVAGLTMLSLEINMNRKPLKVTQLRLQGHNVFKCYANIVYIKYFYKCRGRRWYKTALVQQNVCSSSAGISYQQTTYIPLPRRTTRRPPTQAAREEATRAWSAAHKANAGLVQSSHFILGNVSAS